MISFLNKRLLTLFLILGSTFFAVALFLFFYNGTFNKHYHSINLNSIKIIKNDFAFKKSDSTQQYRNEFFNKHIFKLINKADNMVYLESERFDLEKVLVPVTFNIQEDNSFIPILSFKDEFKLVLDNNGDNLYEFELKKLDKLLRLDRRTYYNENKAIKLQSKDKKLIFFLVFNIN